MSDQFAEGLRKAAKIIAARREAYQDEYGQYDPTTGVTEYPGNGDEWVQEWVDCEEAILAAIPAPAPWTPPPEAERPEGFECLGRGVKGSSWHHIQWNNGRWWLRSPGIQAFGLVAFAPLPPAPEDAP